LLTVVDELMPGAFHNLAQYANNRIECDHWRAISDFASGAAAHARGFAALLRGAPLISCARRLTTVCMLWVESREGA
jgi:hypothetical protein